MSPRSFLLDDRLNDYVVGHTEPADAVMVRLTERTVALGDPAGMQVGPDQAAFLTMLTRFAAWVQKRLQRRGHTAGPITNTMPNILQGHAEPGDVTDASIEGRLS